MPPIQPRQDQGLPLVAELICHPDSACPEVASFQARASFLDPEVLSLGFTLAADLARLKLPETGPAVWVDRLWEHTCFEVFLAQAEGEDYFELNVAPSSAWAATHFSRYREGGEPALALAPRLVLHRRSERLDAHILLQLDPTLTAMRLRIGFSAVVERQDGSLSYWAIRHPAGRPDFHHPANFALALVPPPEED